MKKIGILSLALLLSIQAKEEAAAAAAKAAQEADALQADRDNQVAESHEEEARQRQAEEARQRQAEGAAHRSRSNAVSVRGNLQTRNGQVSTIHVTNENGNTVAADFVSHRDNDGDVSVEEDATLGSVVPTAVEQNGPSRQTILSKIKKLTLPTFKENITRIAKLFPNVRFPKFNFSRMFESIKNAPERAVGIIRNLRSFLNRNPEAVAEPIVQVNREPVIRFTTENGTVFEAPLNLCGATYADLASIIETGDVTQVSKDVGNTSDVTQEQAIVIKEMLHYYSSPKMRTTLNEAWDKFAKTKKGQEVVTSMENAKELSGGLDPQHEMHEKIRYLMAQVDENGYSLYLSRNFLTSSRFGSGTLETMTTDEINQNNIDQNHADYTNYAVLEKQGLSENVAKLLVEYRMKIRSGKQLDSEEEALYRTLERFLETNIAKKESEA